MPRYDFEPPERIAQFTYLSQDGEAKRFIEHPGQEVEIEVHQESQFAVSDLTIKGTVRSYTWMYEDGLVREEVEIIMNSESRLEHTDELDFGVYTSPFKSIKLDKKYPHICFKCKKPLRFMELRAANMSEDENHLKNLWKLEGIEFFCCTCYAKKEVEEHGKPT